MAADGPAPATEREALETEDDEDESDSDDESELSELSPAHGQKVSNHITHKDNSLLR